MFKDDLVKAALISNVFYAAGYPGVQKALISNVTDKYIAINAIVVCTMSIFLGKTWERYSKRLYKTYGLSQVLKSGFYVFLLILILNDSFSYKFYYIADTLITAVVAKNIIFGSNKLKALRYNQQNRNEFDNKSLIATSIASLAGLSACLALQIPIKIAFTLLTIGIVIDSAFNYRVFKQQKNDIERVV